MMTSSREGEMKLYMDACQELNRLRRLSASDRQVEDMLAEIEVIADLTEWPLLRHTCRRTVEDVRYAHSAQVVHA